MNANHHQRLFIHPGRVIKLSMVRNTNAFTLIEIIAVISLMGVMLFFAAPRMEGFLLRNESRLISKWILLNAADLKNKSMQGQKIYFLNIDLDGNRFEIVDAPEKKLVNDLEGMNNEFAEEKAEKSFELPEGYRLNRVLFSKEKRISSGVAAVGFYPQGYSDRAIIHMTDEQNRRKSYIIEAFLPRVKIHDDHVQF